MHSQLFNCLMTMMSFSSLNSYRLRERKKDEREKPLLTKGKRHKVVRFLISPKKKTKIKKNQSPDPAILGRIRTRDPDPDHFGPDFDSGSGCGSAFTDLQSGSPQKHGLVLLITPKLWNMLMATSKVENLAQVLS